MGGRAGERAGAVTIKRGDREMDVTGLAAIVTGGGSGLGAETARKLAHHEGIFTGAAGGANAGAGSTSGSGAGAGAISAGGNG